MYIAIDIGGTNTRILAFSDTTFSSLIADTRFPTEKTFDGQYKKITEYISTIKAENIIKGITISQTGTVSKDKKMLVSSEFCPDFVDKPLVEKLQEEYQCVALIENDALCGGFAELIFGENSEAKRIAYITISTGIGGVYIKKIQGKYEVLKTGLGHLMIVGEKRKCTCGMIDCIEAYVGGHSLGQQFLAEAKNIDDLRVWEKAVEYLGITAVNLIRMCNPESIIFGGGMIDNNKYIREKLSYEIKSQLREREMPTLSISNFGDYIGAYGALALFSVEPSSII